MNGNQIKDLGDPLNSLDAIHRSYADGRYLKIIDLPTSVSSFTNDSQYVNQTALDTRIPQAASDWVSQTSYYNLNNRDIVQLNANLDCGQVRVTPIVSWDNSYTGKIAMVCGISTYDSDANGRIIHGSDAVGPLDIPTFRQIPTSLSQLQNDIGFVTTTSANWGSLQNVPQWLLDVDYFPTASVRPAIVFSGHRARFESIQAFPPLPDSDIAITCGTSTFDTLQMGRIQYVKPGTGPYDVVVKSQMEAAINAATISGGGEPTIPDNLSVVTLTASSSVGAPLGDFTSIKGFTAAGNIDMSTFKITSLPDPSAAHDPVTLSFAENNYANIDSSGRLVLTSGATSLPCFSITEVSQQILPVEQTPNWDVEVLNSLTPSGSLLYNLGQAGRMWRNLYALQAVCFFHSAPPGADIVFAKTTTNAEFDPVWSISSDTSALLPASAETHDIGSPAALVRSLYCKEIGSPANKVVTFDGETLNIDTAYIDIAYTSIHNTTTLNTNTISAQSIDVQSLITADSLELGTGGLIPSLVTELITIQNQGDIVMNGGRITNIGLPSLENDAVNKSYVDSSITAAVPTRNSQLENDSGFVTSSTWTFPPRGRLPLVDSNPINEAPSTWAENPNIVQGASSYIRIPPKTCFNIDYNVSLFYWPINFTSYVSTYEVWEGHSTERPLILLYQGDLTNAYINLPVQANQDFTVKLELWPSNPAGRSTDDSNLITKAHTFIVSAPL